MIVYADRDEVVSTSDLLSEIDRCSDATERLIRFGQLEAGVVDALCPEQDSITPVIAELRRIALDGEYERAWALPLPECVRIRVQEGFAYYALHPEMYAEAAEHFVREVQSRSCVTVGVRSIGTALSTVVQRVCGGESFTVRPQGHPFDRVVRFSGELPRADWYLVVDEGPGRSGSSFASVAQMLSERGVPAERIVFFPSYDADPSAFVSRRAQEQWPRHPKYVEDFDRDRWIPREAIDLSGGLWRGYLGVDVPAVPQNERRKYLDEKSGVLWKWAGLGIYGRRRLERAEALRGFTTNVLGLSDGFIRTSWIEGTPAKVISPELLDRMARYLAFLAEHFDTGRSVDYPALREMVRVNANVDWPEKNPLLADAQAIAGDCRMLPHEWIETSGGWLKTDALDHHDDHFFPGCQDIAWDIAGAGIEFGFDDELLADRYLNHRRDTDLKRRLAYYRVAYKAYSSGYAKMFDLPNG